MLPLKSNRRLAEFFDSLPESFDGFERRGTWLVRPTDHFIQGFCFESASLMPDHRWICAFVYPMFDGLAEIHFAFRKRLSAKSDAVGLGPLAIAGETDRAVQVMIDDGLRFFDQYSGVRAILRRCSEDRAFIADNRAYAEIVGGACLVLLNAPLDDSLYHLRQGVSLARENSAMMKEGTGDYFDLLASAGDRVLTGAERAGLEGALGVVSDLETEAKAAILGRPEFIR